MANVERIVSSPLPPLLPTKPLRRVHRENTKSKYSKHIQVLSLQYTVASAYFSSPITKCNACHDEERKKNIKIESIQLAYVIMCVSHILFVNEIQMNFIHSIWKFGALANEGKNNSDLYQKLYMRRIMCTSFDICFWF